MTAVAESDVRPGSDKPDREMANNLTNDSKKKSCPYAFEEYPFRASGSRFRMGLV